MIISKNPSSTDRIESAILMLPADALTDELLKAATWGYGFDRPVEDEHPKEIADAMDNGLKEYYKQAPTVDIRDIDWHGEQVLRLYRERSTAK